MSPTPSQPASERSAPRPALGGRTAWLVLTVGQFAAVIAVLQRSSLGVATTDALARFGITAATLAAFSMVQLLVYAALQVPVGVLIDRYGSRLLIVLGSLIMAGAQTIFAFAAALPAAFAARVVLGIGDALVFISVMRLVPAWFPPQRSAALTNATGPVNQLGFVLSAVGFASVLAAVGWTPSFLAAAAVSVASAVLALLLLRDSPLGRPPRVPLRQALAAAGHGVREAWAEPGTRLGFWLGFMALFTGMTFGVMWGYPFLTVGQGLSPGTAGVLMLGLAVAGLVYGVTLGTVMAHHPYYRSLIAIGVVIVVAAIWAVVLLWPGRAPVWLLVVLVLAVPAPTIGAVMTFDIARTSNPPRRLGSAIGVVNGGAFLGTLTAVMAIGLVLQVTTPAGSTDYSLDSFKWAFSVQYVLWAIGIVQTLRYRRRTIRALIARDPEAYAALRRGVHLSPPT
ncbi:MFS transporter [Pseudonocardia charpentierae]|uniref:MFS transporter n=1 Tax=Pseudonocardia charpentierae TaxID=3075545 RepID=A0ABU2NF92_9PSEU|nr:MFS transporter [Pseudonocardia sp. DSM 45834]MDT0352405.1 MFS transporter [Pseudonocardia sp. DSM 45834]